jgi:predicted ATPase
VALKITHLRLENWRNFRTVDVSLRDRSFLVGPNASGKSNFLDALRFLRDLATVGGGFEKAVAQRDGVSRLRCLFARRQPGITFDVTLSDESVETWRYRLSFTQDNQRRPIIADEQVWRLGKSLVHRPDRQDQLDRELLRQTHLEQVSANRDFRAIADFFASIRYYHIVPQLVREPDRSVGHVADPFGGDFLEQLYRTNTNVRQSRLRRIEKALQVAVPQLTELVLERDDRGVPHLRGRYEHWRPAAGWQNEKDFSDGTLRLLGLLWALLDGSGPLLLEEPELSLHPGVVRYIPELMTRVQHRQSRQILVSTHSSELLGDEGIGAKEVLLFTPTRNGTVAAAGLVGRLLRTPPRVCLDHVGSRRGGQAIGQPSPLPLGAGDPRAFQAESLARPRDWRSSIARCETMTNALC